MFLGGSDRPRVALALAGLSLLVFAFYQYLTPSKPIAVQSFLYGLAILPTAAAPILIYMRHRSFYGLRVDDFNSHVMVLGRTGAGKTSLVLRAVGFLSRRGVRYVIIDWKGEYLHEAKRVYGFNIFKTLNDRLQPMVIAEAFKEAFNLTEPQAYVLFNCLQEFFERKCSRAEELLRIIKERVPASRVEAEIQSALLRRLWVLTLYESGESIPAGNVVIDLSRIPLTELKAVYAVVALWNIYREAVYGGARKLHTIVVVEEAQNIIRRTSNTPSIGERIVNECRAFGVGCIIIAPDPYQLPLHLEGDVGTLIAFGSLSLPPRLFEMVRQEVGRKSSLTNKLLIFHKGELHVRRIPKPIRKQAVGGRIAENRADTNSMADKEVFRKAADENIIKVTASTSNVAGQENSKSGSRAITHAEDNARVIFKIGSHDVEELEEGEEVSSLRCIRCGFTAPITEASKVKEHSCQAKIRYVGGVGYEGLQPKTRVRAQPKA